MLPLFTLSKTHTWRPKAVPTLNQLIPLAPLAIAMTLLAAGTSDGGQITFGHEPLEDPAATITFGEVGLGTMNPTYEFSNIPNFGDLKVSFGSVFRGQVLGDLDNSLVVTQPDGPLALDKNGPSVATLFDIQSASPPVLGGADNVRVFSTPLALQFEQPVNAVSFELGSFDGPGTTYIEVFDQGGQRLGFTQNTSGQFETVSAQSTDIDIAGVSVYVTEQLEDWEGFGLNNVAVVAIPEPTSLAIAAILFPLAATVIRRKIRR